ncbi:T7SS effector LXG polymorphic toxin [Enterococcus termitis]
MSVDMYVSTSRSQASSVSTMCKSQVEGYHELQKAITDFVVASPFLTGKAYDSAKDYFQSVLYPLAQGGILLSEAVEKAVKKFPEEYISQVDSGDLKQSELEEKIRRADRLLNQAEDIRKDINSSKTPDITKTFQLIANSMLIGMYSASKQKLEEQLRKLLAFNASSPSIFSEISSLQSAMNTGLAQTKTAWNEATGTFSIPKDLSWKNTINERWKSYQEKI